MILARGLFLAASLIFAVQSEAYEQLGRSIIQLPRMTAMGGAGIGLADDEYTLFYNPAGLAGSNMRRLQLMGLGVEGSWDIATTVQDSLSAFKTFNQNSMNLLMGKDIYVRGGITPMVLLPHFAIAYVNDFQGAISEYNTANPTFHFGDQITRGIQAGMGWSFSHGRHPKDEYRFGLSGKYLWRRGGYYDVSTSGFLAATTDPKGFINNIVGDYGTGMGIDTGFQYVNHMDKKSDISFGISGTDITYTHFSSQQAAVIPASWGFGFGYKTHIPFFKLAAAADLRDFNRDTSFSNKVHFGGELGIPLMDFYLGWSQLSMTYGFAFDLWVMRIDVMSYEQQLGNYYNQQASRRYMLHINLNLPI